MESKLNGVLPLSLIIEQCTMPYGSASVRFLQVYRSKNVLKEYNEIIAEKA